MPIQNLQTIADETTFNSRLRSVIGKLEGDRPLAYFDSVGLPTIGVGFNLKLTGSSLAFCPINEPTGSSLAFCPINV